MRKWLKQTLATMLCLAGCSPHFQQQPTEIRHWAVYYNTELPAEVFEGLDLVIFDRRYHPADFPSLQNRTILLAYVSLGEVYNDVPEKDKLAEDNALLYENKTWNSHAVDLTSPRWRQLVLGYVDDAIARGFDGVMLDTVDSPLHWAKTEKPETRTAMREGALMLIHAIREKHPDKKIMLNNGFAILDDAAPDLDYLLAESILTHKDDFTGQFRLLPPKAYQDVVAQLHTVIARAENLQVVTLDYWDMEDTDGVGRVYDQQRASGFIPYVTSPDLKLYTPEPKHLSTGQGR